MPPKIYKIALFLFLTRKTPQTIHKRPIIPEKLISQYKNIEKN